MKKEILLIGLGVILLGGAFFVKAFDMPVLKNMDHNASFHTLHLNNSKDAMTVVVTGKKLHVLNGIIVGTTSESKLKVSALGGNEHSIAGENSGIGGGRHNIIIKGENSIIGGGSGNGIAGDNVLVAGGVNNHNDGGIVVGGINNSSLENGFVLGGSGNSVGENGLVLGKNVNAGDGSFAWNSVADNNSAGIDAENGILIGTMQPISGVNLVVNGAVKISGNKDFYSTSIIGEVREINGCFYAYDGEYRHIVNQDSNCKLLGTAQYCKFGNVQLKEGDKVYAYKDGFAKVCEKQLVTCKGGNLVSDNGSLSNYSKSWCYEIK